MSSRLSSYLLTAPFRHSARSSVPFPTIVLGNDAADLDSIVSSLSYAVLHSSEEPHIAFVAIPRADLALRTECTFALKDAFTSRLRDVEQSLVFIDELNLDALRKEHQLKLVLVDHNRLSPSLERFSACVQGIVDHHLDEGLYKHVQPRIISPVGSATTLVAELWARQDVLVDADLARLMIGTILIDTVNLKEAYGRVTERDREAVNYLLKFARRDAQDSKESFLDNLYVGLHKAKCNITELLSYDLLRKDFKEWTSGRYRMGISSIMWHMGGWIQREGEYKRVHDACTAFAKEKHLDLFIVMTAFDHAIEKPEGGRGFERELVVFFEGTLLEADRGVRDKIVRSLESSELQLRARPEPGNVYRQENIRCSRKQVQPIVDMILKSL